MYTKYHHHTHQTNNWGSFGNHTNMTMIPFVPFSSKHGFIRVKYLQSPLTPSCRTIQFYDHVTLQSLFIFHCLLTHLHFPLLSLRHVRLPLLMCFFCHTFSNKCRAFFSFIPMLLNHMDKFLPTGPKMCVYVIHYVFVCHHLINQKITGILLSFEGKEWGKWLSNRVFPFIITVFVCRNN